MGLAKKGIQVTWYTFGLGLEVDDVDRLIFLEKIKKLVDWCFIHLSLGEKKH
jgi:hypothetical protein